MTNNSKAANIWTADYDLLFNEGRQVAGNNFMNFDAAFASSPITKESQKIYQGILDDNGDIYHLLDSFLQDNAGRLVLSSNMIFITLPFEGTPLHSIKVTKNLLDKNIYLNIYENDNFQQKTNTLGLFNFSLIESPENENFKTGYEIAYHIEINENHMILEGKTVEDGVIICNGFLNELIKNKNQGVLLNNKYYNWDINLQDIFNSVIPASEDAFIFFDYNDVHQEYEKILRQQLRRPGSNDVIIKRANSKIYSDLVNTLYANNIVNSSLLRVAQPMVYEAKFNLYLKEQKYVFKLRCAVIFQKIGSISIEMFSEETILASLMVRKDVLRENIEMILCLSDDHGKELFTSDGISFMNALITHLNFYDGYVKIAAPVERDFYILELEKPKDLMDLPALSVTNKNLLN